MICSEHRSLKVLGVAVIPGKRYGVKRSGAPGMVNRGECSLLSLKGRTIADRAARPTDDAISGVNRLYVDAALLRRL